MNVLVRAECMRCPELMQGPLLLLMLLFSFSFSSSFIFFSYPYFSTGEGSSLGFWNFAQGPWSKSNRISLNKNNTIYEYNTHNVRDVCQVMILYPLRVPYNTLILISYRIQNTLCFMYKLIKSFAMAIFVLHPTTTDTQTMARVILFFETLCYLLNLSKILFQIDQLYSILTIPILV